MSQAYDMIYNAILDGAYSPGDRLRETELAAQTGLSRTPVREAIRKLESDGIVEHAARVGAVVKTLSQQEIVELYEMRIVIEATAARMAAQHIAQAEIATLEAINADIAAGGAPAALAKRNRDFHGCILDAARNRYLQQSFAGLAHHFVLLGSTTIESPARSEEVAAQHEGIIAALRARDGDAAAAAMEAHMQTSLVHRLKDLRA
ncbi:MAG: GntR family transcriptional regulator [Pseudomonadota bacterium]